jgi:hypothetical protein
MDGPLIPPGALWRQGDILEGIYFPALDEPRPGLLVTPICDIEHDRATFWTFVALFPDEDEAEKAIRKVALSLDGASWDEQGALIVTRRQEKKIREYLDRLVAQDLRRYQWLPPLQGVLGGMVADFEVISSIPVKEATTKKKVASMASSWREQVPARYSAFMGRIGTEDLPRSEIEAHVTRLLSTVQIKARA